MEIARPLPSSLSSSQPPSLPQPRHRRPAFSGKLLNLFAAKPKSAAQPPRPVISQPQPLQSRIPALPKRVNRELSNDENEPPAPFLRPRPRPRLHSDGSTASNHTVLRPPSPGHEHHTPPKGDRARPLKSALKKSASENAPSSFSPHSRLPSSSSLPPETLPKSSKSKAKKRISGGSWMPFSSSSRNHATRAPGDVSNSRPLSNAPRQKKTVSFALDEPESRVSTSKSSRMFSSGEMSHWDEIALELDAPAPSRPPSLLKRKAEEYPEPRRSPLPPRSGSPTLTRRAVFKPASPPPVSYRLPLPNQRIWDDKDRTADAYASVDDRTVRRLPRTAARAKSERAPGLTFMGGIIDEALQECAKEKIRSPPRNLKTTTKYLQGPPGVLRRITADIVPNERHSVVWDATERDTFAWGGTIILRDAKAASYFYPRHCIRNFQLEFCALPEPRSGLHASTPDPDPDAPPTYDWRCAYAGHFLKREEVRSRLDVARGIALEPDFVFVKPDDPDGPHAWMVHFWVPVPLSLFTRSVHRTFLCRAKITVGGYDTPETVIPAGCIAAGIESLKSDGFIALAAGVRDGRAEEC